MPTSDGGRSRSCPTARTPRRRGARPSWGSAPSSAGHGNRDATPAPWPLSVRGGAGYPTWAGQPRRGQTYAGTDRQVRGRLLAVARNSRTAVEASELVSLWADDAQRDRALQGLLDDGLLVTVENGRYALPH